MPQSSVIAAYLLLGFVVYITLKGELPQYRAVLFGSSAGAGAVGSDATTQNTAPVSQSLYESLSQLESAF